MAEEIERKARDRFNNPYTADEPGVAEWQTIERIAQDRFDNLTTTDEPEVAEWQTTLFPYTTLFRSRKSVV